MVTGIISDPRFFCPYYSL